MLTAKAAPIVSGHIGAVTAEAKRHGGLIVRRFDPDVGWLAALDRGFEARIQAARMHDNMARNSIQTPRRRCQTAEAHYVSLAQTQQSGRWYLAHC